MRLLGTTSSGRETAVSAVSRPMYRDLLNDSRALMREKTYVVNIVDFCSKYTRLM
jgi:hypothetical protein